MSDLDKVIQYWFHELEPSQWFNGGPEFDLALKQRWSALYENALNGDYITWRQSAEGCVALCLLWDQFPRNAFRGTPRAFASDYLALDIARSALAAQMHTELPPERCVFLYMPLMHSENMDDQARSIVIQHQLEQTNSTQYAILHAKVIQQFGRYPGRNAALGRATSAKEEAFLQTAEGQSF